MSSIQTTTGRRAARRASRRAQVQHLITADEHSLLELEVVLATLPLCAVGRVFIEVPEVADIADVTAPPRMTVTWLPRARSGAAARPVGSLLTAASMAWAGEMLCEGSEDALRTEAILLGDIVSTSDIAERLSSKRGSAPVTVHTPGR